MKPLSIVLPDHVRDELDARLGALVPDHVASADEQDEIDRQAIAIINDVIYPNAPRPDLRELHNALSNVQRAEGSPVVLLENLPEKNTTLFYLALMSTFLGDQRGIVPRNMVVADADKIDLHQDDVFKMNREKLIRGLLCVNPGEKPKPTIFALPEEVTHAYACFELDLPPMADEAMIKEAGKWSEFCTIRDAFEAELRTIRVFPLGKHDADGNYYTKDEPFLQDRPERDKNPESQRLVTCWPDREEQSLKESIPDDAQRAIFEDKFVATQEKMRTALSEQSLASLRSRTCVIWNDALVCHDRGLLVGPAPEIAKGKRTLLSTDAKSAFMGELCSMERAIGEPVAEISEAYLRGRCQAVYGHAVAAV